MNKSYKNPKSSLACSTFMTLNWGNILTYRGLFPIAHAQNRWVYEWAYIFSASLMNSGRDPWCTDFQSWYTPVIHHILCHLVWRLSFFYLHLKSTYFITFFVYIGNNLSLQCSRCFYFVSCDKWAKMTPVFVIKIININTITNIVTDGIYIDPCIYIYIYIYIVNWALRNKPVEFQAQFIHFHSINCTRKCKMVAISSRPQCVN